ncbi:hypothetical protein J7L87_04420 [bacterium]|nr:hypothetical protein [bacterium]
MEEKEILKEIYRQEKEIREGEKKRIDYITFISLFSSERKVATVNYISEISNPVILIPGAGTDEKKAEKILEKKRYLLREGFTIIFYNLKKKLPPDDKGFFKFFRESIGEIKGIMSYLEKNYGIKKFSVLGISLGGIMGFVLSGVDERVKKAVILISGGNFELITWRSLLRFTLRKDCPRNACKRMHKTYKKFLKEGFYKGIMDFPRKCFLYDPMTYAELLDGKKVLMINGLFDFVIPFYSALSMKRRIKNCRIIWYPGTHLTIKFFLPFLRKSIVKFLKNEN